MKVDDDSRRASSSSSDHGSRFRRTRTVTTDTITVAVAQVPTRLTASSLAQVDQLGFCQGDVDADATTITMRLTDSDGRGIAGESLTVIASHGTLSEIEASDRPTVWAERDDAANTV